MSIMTSFTNFLSIVKKFIILKLPTSTFEIFDAYHTIDKEVYRVENNIEPRSDAALEELKKRRLVLKDELFRIIRQSKP